MRQEGKDIEGMEEETANCVRNNVNQDQERRKTDTEEKEERRAWKWHRGETRIEVRSKKRKKDV